MLRTTLVAAMMAAFSGGVSAAGLGRINVMSSLGQPLRAEVELTASSDELENMVVRMASPEAYKRANIDYLSVFGNVRLSIERRGARAVVKVVSDKPFGEPYVGLLFDLNWAGGRLQREYTFLLDPADLAGPKAVIPVQQPLSQLVGVPQQTVSDASEPGAPQMKADSPMPSSVSSTAKPEMAVPASPKTKPAEVASSSSTAQAASDEYTVKRGDNLSKIASELNAGSVSQEQMLAALYRANTKAFVDGNINRLRAGRILKVPDAGEVQALSKGEARKIVFKASNFEQYRQTVASAAAAMPAKDEAGQAASGKIAPKVEDNSGASTQTKDKVKVTATEAGKSGADSASVVASKARIQALQDDIASREKALKEANSRVFELEKNVKELQKLIDLKSKGLADAQSAAKVAESRAEQAEKAKLQAEKPVPAAPAVQEQPAPVVEAPAAPAVESAPAIVSVEESSPAVPESTPTEIVEPKPAAVVAAPVVPAPAEEGGLFSNLWALLALGGVAAVIAFVVAKQRRKQAAVGSGSTLMTDASTTSPNSVFGNAGGQTVDTGGTSLMHTDFSQSGMSAIDSDEGVDPVAEADVYMAYGRDAQAEEILLDALKTDPSRTAVYVKLLEVYAQRKSLKQFENIATDLYTQTGGVGDDWARAASLGVKLDPANPLYSAAKAVVEEVVVPPADVPAVKVESPAVSFGTNNVSQVRATWTVPGEISQFTGDGAAALEPAPVSQAKPAAVPEALNLDFNLDLDSPTTDEVPTRVQAAPVDDVLDVMEEAVSTQPSLTASAPLEFDIGLDDDDDAMVATEGVQAPLSSMSETEFDIGIEADGDHDTLSEVDLEKTNFEGSLLDFDFELGDEAEKPTIDLTNLSLNAGHDEPTKVVEKKTSAPAQHIQDNIDVADEVSTKLELAKAYEEMGDMEGARELLEEVVSDGADFQKEQAKTMLGRLS